jgi:hypothetical protein
LLRLMKLGTAHGKRELGEGRPVLFGESQIGWADSVNCSAYI